MMLRCSFFYTSVNLILLEFPKSARRAGKNQSLHLFLRKSLFGGTENPGSILRATSIRGNTFLLQIITNPNPRQTKTPKMTTSRNFSRFKTPHFECLRTVTRSPNRLGGCIIIPEVHAQSFPNRPPSFISKNSRED